MRRGNEDVVERARLHLVFSNHQGRRAYADIVNPTASSDTPELVRARAARDGAAAARAEDGKRLRYPGPDLIPFAIKALGRPGADAVSLLRAFAPTDPEERSQVLGAAWQSLSTVVQMANAELVMGAAA